MDVNFFMTPHLETLSFDSALLYSSALKSALSTDLPEYLTLEQDLEDYQFYTSYLKVTIITFGDDNV